MANICRECGNEATLRIGLLEFGQLIPELEELRSRYNNVLLCDECRQEAFPSYEQRVFNHCNRCNNRVIYSAVTHIPTGLCSTRLDTNFQQSIQIEIPHCNICDTRESETTGLCYRHHICNNMATRRIQDTYTKHVHDGSPTVYDSYREQNNILICERCYDSEFGGDDELTNDICTCGATTTRQVVIPTGLISNKLETNEHEPINLKGNVCDNCFENFSQENYLESVPY